MHCARHHSIHSPASGFQIYYLFNTWKEDNSTGCPAVREGTLAPGEDYGNRFLLPAKARLCCDNAVNDVYLSCEEGRGGEVVMQSCLTIGTAPFDTLNGTYTTFEFYLLHNCEGIKAHTRLYKHIMNVLICIILHDSVFAVTFSRH